MRNHVQIVKVKDTQGNKFIVPMVATMAGVVMGEKIPCDKNYNVIR